MLKEISDRLVSGVRSSDFVARLGGDEFAALSRPIGSSSDAASLTARLLRLLRQPVVVHGLPIAVDSSIGIAIFPEHGENFDILMRNADTAMYVAKRNGGGIEVFDGERDWKNHGRMKLIADLAHAISHDELILDYQPKIDIATGKLVGVEALTRWLHPAVGLVQPSDFIPLAEHTELIEPFTEHVLRRALQQCKDWLDSGAEIGVSVNASARNLHDTRFAALVRTLLRETGVPASLLEIELTENTVMEDPLRTVAVATELRAMGVRLAIDDFGTGYSSLATLRDLPVTAIKIDRSFVTTLSSNLGNATIVSATIDLAHRLGLQTIAEGVEDGPTLSALRDLGCDVAQGYFLGRPTTPENIAAAMNAPDAAIVAALSPVAVLR